MTGLEGGPVLLDIADGIADLRLNRPEASNGVTVDSLRALHDAVLRCHTDSSVRVVVLSGKGRHFCVGGDIRAFADRGPGLPDYLREATHWLQATTAALMQLRAPVVAAVQGFASGGAGLGFVCAADLVVAAESAKFFSGAVRAGIGTDGGTTVTLAQIVGLRKAIEILLLSPTLTAREARDLGLVNEVVPDDVLRDRTFEVASTLAAQPPLAVAAMKRLVWAGVGATVQERLAEEARVVSELAGTADAHEGLAALIERRPGTFTGS